MWGFFAFFGSDKAAVNTSLENGLGNSSCWCGDCRWLLLGKRKWVSGACEEDWKGTGGFIPGGTEDCGYLLLEGQGVIPALRSAGSVVQPL